MSSPPVISGDQALVNVYIAHNSTPGTIIVANTTLVLRFSFIK
jgi:hypothetical protein